jgi:hypothetical protein
MHRSLISRVAALGFAIAGFAIASPALAADDFLNRITIDIAPNYQAAVTGDAAAANPPGFTNLGYTSDHQVPSTTQLDYGLDFRIDNKTHFYYTHSNLDFAIGRVLTLAPKTALVSGLIADRTDTVGLNRDFGHGLLGRIYYYNHARMDVTGLCLNQQACPNPATGFQQGNPASIAEHGYGAGFSYNLGPRTRIGQLLTLGFDAKYVPRPGTPPSTAPNLGGLGSYVGSQWLFPYSATLKIPVLPVSTTIPYIGYERASVLFRNEATPEVYNVSVLGLTQIITKQVSVGIQSLNFSGCRCSDTVPPPDNIRFAEVLLRLDYRFNP